MSMYRNPPMTPAGYAKLKRSKRAREAYAQVAQAEGQAIGAHALHQKRSAAAKKAAATRAKKYGKRKASPTQIKALRREGAYKRALKKGLPPEKAAARAMREVPYKKSQRGRVYKGLKVYTGKAAKSTAKPRRKPGPMPRQYKTTKATRKVKRTVATRVKRKVRVAYRRYKRVSLQDPRSGKQRLSYMYRGKKKRLKKIPAWAIAGARSAKEFATSDKFAKARARITKRRAAAARRMEKSGGPFTPNRSKKNMRKKTGKHRSRSAAAKAGWRKRRAKKAARRVKRTVGRGRGRLGVKLRRGKIYYKGKKPRVLKGRRKGVRRLPKARILLTNRKSRKYSANKSRKSTKRSRAAKKAWRTRKARAAARRSPKRRRRSRGRKLTANRRRSRKLTANRRPSRRRARGSNRRSRRSRRYSANQFMASLKKLGATAIFAVTGFVAHKVLTRLGIIGLAKALESSTGTWKPTVMKWSPIVIGGLVAGLGVAAVSKVAPTKRNEIGAGMIVSFFHTSILTVLGMVDNADVQKAAQWIAGYDTSSTATSIGRYRRSMQGLGDAMQRSTLPHYAPTGRRGGIQQAVAGRGTGEYFQASGLGEYFASGVQGIGAYELAGPLVTQAAAGLGQRIDDGIRPDANLDAVLTLAEAMAGGSMGEYYSADPSGSPFTVPEDDQWVPNNPLWAGTKGAEDSPETSEIPAGILETSGGNGIFG